MFWFLYCVLLLGDLHVKSMFIVWCVLSLNIAQKLHEVALLAMSADQSYDSGLLELWGLSRAYALVLRPCLITISFYSVLRSNTIDHTWHSRFIVHRDRRHIGHFSYIYDIPNKKQLKGRRICLDSQFKGIVHHDREGRSMGHLVALHLWSRSREVNVHAQLLFSDC